MKLLTQDSALRRGIIRLLWMGVAGAATLALTYLTDTWANAAWYPLIYMLVTTIRDIANKELPNLPTTEGK